MKTALKTVLISVMTLIGGCSRQVGSGSLPRDETFVELYADLLVLQERNTLLHPDSARVRNAKDSLMAHYQVSGKEYDEAIESTRSDLPRWKEFNEKVIRRLEDLQKKGEIRKDSAGNLREKGK